MGSKPLSVKENTLKTSDAKLFAFPNPTSNFIEFYAESRLIIDKRLRVYASNGELMLDQILNSHRISLDALKAGLYYLKLEGFEGKRIIVLK